MEATVERPFVPAGVPFICENCLRPGVLVNDAAEPLPSSVFNRQGGLPSLLPTQGLNPDFGATAAEESYASDTFVLLPPIGESLSAAPQTPRSCCKPKGSSLIQPTAPLNEVNHRAFSAPPIERAVHSASDAETRTVVHPLCCGCLDAAIAELAPVSAHEKRLIRKYEKALKRLECDRQRRTDSATPLTPTEAKLQKLEEEEAKLLNEITLLESTTAQKESEQLEVVADLAELHMWHVEFWQLFSNHLLRTVRHEERKRAMERLFIYISQELQRLKRTNVVNDAFHIWTSKFLPSINMCRIGRISSPSCPSWPEVNTGWGYMCLLLDVFYRKCRVQPSTYRIAPRGQFSFLVRKKDGVVLPLHGGGGEVGLSRFFYSNKRFDTAMTAFLECVKELFDRLARSAEDQGGQRMSSVLPAPELPYEIDGDRVGGFSIRLQLNQDERWTKALKHLLINMKWMLEYIERVSLMAGAAP